jgi:hypothetical protein
VSSERDTLLLRMVDAVTKHPEPRRGTDELRHPANLLA